MIEIKGSPTKSIIFERLVSHRDTAGIIFDWKLIMATNENVYAIDNPSLDGIVKFIKSEMSLFNHVVIYSNYSSSEIKPFMDGLKDLENETNINFIIMYQGE